MSIAFEAAVFAMCENENKIDNSGNFTLVLV